MLAVVDIDVTSSGLTSLALLDLPLFAKLDWLSAANNQITEVAKGMFVNTRAASADAVAVATEGNHGGSGGGGLAPSTPSRPTPNPPESASDPMVVTVTVASSLRYLDLRNNKISYVAPSVFEDLPQLEVLLLQGNLLTQFGGSRPQLNRPEWGGANGEHQPNGGVAPCTLRRLELSANRLTAIAPAVFQDAVRLGVLTLDNNALSVLPPGLFRGAANIRLLHLNNNKLTAASLGVFAELPALKVLLLSHNGLTVLPAYFLNNNTMLGTLDMRHNAITDISPFAFPSSWHVARLGNGAARNDGSDAPVDDADSADSRSDGGADLADADSGEGSGSGDATGGSQAQTPPQPHPHPPLRTQAQGHPQPPSPDVLLQMQGNPSACEFGWRDFSNHAAWDTVIPWIPHQSCIAQQCRDQLVAASLQPASSSNTDREGGMRDPHHHPQLNGESAGDSSANGAWWSSNATFATVPWGLLPTEHATATAMQTVAAASSAFMAPAIPTDAGSARAAANLAECVASHCTASDVVRPRTHDQYGLACSCAAGTWPSGAHGITNINAATCLPVQCTPTIPPPSTAQGWLLKASVCPRRGVGDTCSLECHHALGHQKAYYRCTPNGVWVPVNENAPLQCNNMLRVSPAALDRRFTLPVPPDAVSVALAPRSGEHPERDGCIVVHRLGKNASLVGVDVGDSDHGMLDADTANNSHSGSSGGGRSQHGGGDLRNGISVVPVYVQDVGQYFVELMFAVREVHGGACAWVGTMLKQSGVAITLQINASSPVGEYSYSQRVQVIQWVDSLDVLPARHAMSYNQQMHIEMQKLDTRAPIFLFGDPEYVTKQPLPDGLALDSKTGTLSGRLLSKGVPSAINTGPPEELIGWMYYDGDGDGDGGDAGSDLSDQDGDGSGGAVEAGAGVTSTPPLRRRRQRRQQSASRSSANVLVEIFAKVSSIAMLTPTATSTDVHSSAVINASMLYTRVAEYTLDLFQPLSVRPTVHFLTRGQPLVYDAPPVFGGTGAITYMVLHGTLPDGTAMDRETGRITGTLTAVSNWTFVSIGAEDGGGGSVPVSSIWWIVRPTLNVTVDTRHASGMLVQDTLFEGRAPAFNINNATASELGVHFTELAWLEHEHRYGHGHGHGHSHEHDDSRQEYNHTGVGGNGSLGASESSGENDGASGDATTSLNLTTLGSAGMYTFVYSASGLPDGVTVDAETGALAGTPRVSGAYSVVYTITEQAKRITVVVVGAPYTVNVTQCASWLLRDCGGGDDGSDSMLEPQRRAWIIALLGLIFFLVALFVTKGCHRYQQFIDKASTRTRYTSAI